MNLILDRDTSGVSCTIGHLSIQGHPFCDSIEDLLREIPGEPVETWKVPGDTAIPAGTYVVKLTVSDRAKRGHLWTPDKNFKLPQIMDVPGFVGIRIHAANTALDVEGCIGVGTWSGGESIYKSRPALSSLIDLIEVSEIAGRPCTIEIRNPPRES